MVDENLPPGAAPRKSGASILLWILGIGVLGCVLCCGAVGVVAWKFGDAFKNFAANLSTDDPEEIHDRTDEMVDIEIPERFKPMQALNLGIMEFVMYQTDRVADGSMGMLMLMEMSMQGANAQQQEQQLRQQMQQQQQAQAGHKFQAGKSETKQIQIRGEPVPFEFTEGAASGQGQEKKMHMVSGVFRGKNGLVMLQLTLPDDEYDEDEIVAMIESIK